MHPSVFPAIPAAASRRDSRSNRKGIETARSCSVQAALSCVIAFLLFTVPVLAQQSLLTRHVREAVLNGQAKLVGDLPANQIMQLDIVLPLSDQAGLDAFLKELYDPASSSYRHFLTVAEFTAKFGPSQADYDSVVAFAKANGFTVVGGTRDGMEVQVKGPVSAIETAFHVNMRTYQHPTENRTFFAPDREPTANLPFRLWHISGLDNYSIPHTMLVSKSDYAQAHGIAPEAVVTHASTGSGPSASFLGSDMRAAYYGGTALTGAGQNLGLFEFVGTDLTDLATYFNNTGQTNNVPVTLLSTDGTITNCEAANNCDDTEQTLDMTQAISMAPGLSSLVMYIGSSDTAILSAMTAPPNPIPLPATIGCSWGWTPVDPSTLDPYFQRMAAQGQNFFAASGDSSTWSSSNEAWPADDANVVSVGGTDLVTASAGGPWQSEIAWSDSGGGISPDAIAIPTWQQIPSVINSSNHGSTTLRNGPDVSANANFTFYTCANQTTCLANEYGGTSFAAPMWAGYIALVNQQLTANGEPSIGFLNPAIYTQNVTSAYNTDFHDITNGTSGSYSAVTGYDLVTGWGSPNGQNLISTLAPQGPGFLLSASPGSLSINLSASGTATITVNDQDGFSGSINLSVSGLPSGVAASFGANPATGTSVLTLTASSTVAAGTYNVIITGTSGALSATTALLLTINPGPGFTLGVSPASQAIVQNTSGICSITVNDLGGFTGSVQLAVSGLPSGVTALFGANPTTGISALELTVSSSAATGTFPVTITGASGSLNATTAISVTVFSLVQITAPTPENFGAVNVGTTSPVIPVVFTFDTAGTFGSEAVLTQGATGLDFADAGTGTCAANTAYAAGQTCTVNVTFTPIFAGTRNGAVVLKYANGNVIATGYIQGTGVGPQIIFSPGAQSTILANTQANSVLSDPIGIAVDGSGNVYIADEVKNVVFKETLSGGSYTLSTVIRGSYPSGLALDGSGNLYIGDGFGKGMFEETPSAGGYTQSEIGSSIASPWGVAVDDSGTLYIINGVANTVFIETPTPSGYVESTLTSISVQAPGGIAVDGSGNLYLSDSFNGVVVKETPSAGSYTQSTVVSGLGQTEGLAVDGNGNVYVADMKNNQIVRMTPTANGYTQSTIANSANNGLYEPYGVALDGSGNLYIADTGNERVLKMDISDPPSLSFTSITDGTNTTTSSQTLTIENIGNAALNFPIPPAGSDPGIEGNFTLNESGASTCQQASSNSSEPASLAAGVSCQLLINFVPPALGIYSGSLTLTDNNLNAAAPEYALQRIPLIGTQSSPSFTIMSSVYSAGVSQGSSITSTITVTPQSGFTVDAHLAAYGLPSGVTTSFSPNPATSSSVLTITASSSATPGTYCVYIVGTSGTESEATFIPYLTIEAVTPPSFSLEEGPYLLSVYQGASATSTITVYDENGFSGSVGLTVSGLPSGVTASFSPNPTTGTSILTLIASSSATPGTYFPIITGTSGKLTETTSFELVINAATFILNSPLYSSSLAQGSWLTSTITVIDQGDFSGSVNLAASGLPSGVTASFTPNPTTGTSVITLTASSTAATGWYYTTITGTSGTLAATTGFGLEITPPSPGLAPSSGNFGAVNIGTTSPPLTFTYTFGTADTLASAAVLTQGATGLDFADAGADTCSANTTYSAGQSCTVNVSFTSKLAGTRYGAVVLYDNSGNVIATGYLQGTGVGPQVNFLPNTESTVASASNRLISPYGVAADGSGNVYIADNANNVIWKETHAASGYTQSALSTSALNNPTGVAVDGSGSIYIADTNNNRVLKETLSAEGYTESVVASVSSAGIVYPSSVAVDGSGNIYIADQGDILIWKETLSAGSYTLTPISCYSPCNPAGIAVDGSGNVYIIDNVNNQAIKETPSEVGYIQSTLPTSGLNSPSGIAVDESANIYIANTASNQVIKETLAAGSYIQSTIFTSQLNSPSGVAVDGSGNVFIADNGNTRVVKEDFADPPSLSFASTSVGSTSTDSPQTVTVENVGNAALSFPIPSTGNNPSIGANFTLNSSGTSACPLVSAGSSTAGTLAAGASCQLPISFAPAAAGALNGSLVVTDNNLNAAAPGDATQSITLNGTGTPAPSFTLGASPASLTVIQGASGTSTIAVTGLNGFAGSVTLAASGLPSGVSAAFATNPTTGSSVLTLTASSTAATGAATVTITGTSGSLTATTTVALTVNPPPSFTLGASPASLTVIQGASGTSTIAVTGLNGFAGSVTLAASGLPSGVSAAFATNPTTGSSVLTLTASSSAAVGSATITIKGTSGSLTATTTLALTIPAPSFTLSDSPGTLTVVQGKSGTSTVTVNDVNGFTGKVTLAASGLPSGVTAAFATNPTTGSSVLTLTASSSAAVGSATITIKGTSGSLTATTTLALTIPPPSFTLGASPASLTVIQGASGKSTITVTGQNGFTGSVTLAASGLPSGVTAAFATNPTTGSSVLTLTASSTVATGAATVTIKGTSGSLTASTTIALTVTCTPTTIVPYISINGGSTWTEESSATVSSPSTVVDLGPQPTSGGSWSWTGPNKYTSTSRQIDDIPLTVGTDSYVVTYTNASGCKSTETFAITVK
jgi:sugar lactone lactonase YvrE